MTVTLSDGAKWDISLLPWAQDTEPEICNFLAYVHLLQDHEMFHEPLLLT